MMAAQRVPVLARLPAPAASCESDLGRALAARMEAAARRRVDQGAGSRRECRRMPLLRLRQAVEQLARVGVARAREEAVDRRVLHLLAGIHHRMRSQIS